METVKTDNKTFGIHEVVMYAATCTNCGRPFRMDDMIAWSDRGSVKDLIQDSGWYVSDGKENNIHPNNCFCPDCWLVNGDDSIGIIYGKKWDKKTDKTI